MAKVIRIQAVPGVTGGRFCRGGRCFGTQPTELRENELTAEQLAAIQAEPMLVVELLEPEPAKPKPEPKGRGKGAATPEAPDKAPEPVPPVDGGEAEGGEK